MSAPARKTVSFQAFHGQPKLQGPSSPAASDIRSQVGGSQRPLAPKPTNNSNATFSRIALRPRKEVGQEKDVANSAAVGGSRMHAKYVTGQVGQRSSDPSPQVSASESQPFILYLTEEDISRRQSSRPHDHLRATLQHRDYSHGLPLRPTQTLQYHAGVHSQATQPAPIASAPDSYYCGVSPEKGDYMIDPFGRQIWMNDQSFQQYSQPQPSAALPKVRHPGKGAFKIEQPLLRHLPPGALISQPNFRENFPPLQYQRTSNAPEALRRREADLRSLTTHYVREANKEHAHPLGVFHDPDETSVEGDSEASPVTIPPRKSNNGIVKAKSTETLELNPNAMKWLSTVTGPGMTDNSDLMTILGLIAHTDLISQMMRVYPRSVDKAGLRDDIEMLEWARSKKVKAWLASAADTKTDKKSAGKEVEAKGREKRKRASSKDSSASTSTKLLSRKMAKLAEGVVDPIMPSNDEQHSQAPPKSMLKHLRAKKAEAIKAAQCETALLPEKTSDSKEIFEKESTAHLCVKAKAIPKPWMIHSQADTVKQEPTA